MFCLETKVSSSLSQNKVLSFLFLSQALGNRSDQFRFDIVTQPLANFLNATAPQFTLLRAINHATVYALVVMLNNGEYTKLVKLKRDIMTLAAKLKDEVDDVVHDYII